jgi:hypothetical protein
MYANLLKLALAAGLVVGNIDKIELFYNELVATTQYVATAGDLRNIVMMLDIDFARRGRYRKTKDFSAWLDRNFKENQIKSKTTDHWGNELIYIAGPDQKTFVLVSRGADGVRGTEDDMTYTGP